MNKVLIVDGETGLKTLLSQVFKEEDLLFTQVTNAKEALKVKDVDLIVLDTILDGDASGLQLISRYRKRKETKDTPIIVITAKDTLNDRALAMEAGANEYLIRPFVLDQLKEKLLDLVVDHHASLS